MPWKTEWVEPTLILTHKDVAVYATYRNGDVDQMRRQYGFTLDTLCGVDECSCTGPCKNVFDVRDLSTWVKPPHPPPLMGECDTLENRAAWDKYYADGVEEKAIEDAIRKAIDEGLLKPQPAEGSEASGSDPE